MGGVVWDDSSFGAPEAVGDNRLRNLYEVVAVPPIAAPLRRLVEWTSDYYLAPPGSVLRMVLPGVAFADAKRPIVEYRATGELPARMTAQRTVAIEKIGERQGMVRELAALAEVSDAVIRGLVNTGALEAVTVSADAPYPEPDPAFAPPDLSDEQTAAAALVDRRRCRREIRDVPARRGDRVGQDRSLYRGDRRRDRRGQAGAGPAPRDRADRTDADALCRALRLRAGGVA